MIIQNKNSRLPEVLFIEKFQISKESRKKMEEKQSLNNCNSPSENHFYNIIWVNKHQSELRGLLKEVL